MLWSRNQKAKKKSAGKTAPETLLWQRLRRKNDPKWYAAYLRCHHWRRLRKRFLESRHYRCEKCSYVDPNHDDKRGTRLHVHHMTYARVGHEKFGDLQALCVKCHKATHGRK